MARSAKSLSLWTRPELIGEIRRLRRSIAEHQRGTERGFENLQAQLQAAFDGLREYEAAADAMRERYAVLFEHAPVAYTVLDRFGVVKALNFRAAELLVENRAVAIGKPLLVYLQPTERQAFLDHMHRLRRARGEVASELTLHSRQRRFVPVRLISHAMPKAADEEQLYQTAIIDLSDLKVAEERMRVTERLASLGTLSAGLAHEINNPLNSILLSAQVALTLAGTVPVGPQIVETLEQIVEEARRGGRLVRNMLAFAKQESTQKWPANLNDFVRRAVTLAGAAHKDAGCMNLQLAPDLPQVAVNPTEIEQVLMNLIRNATEAANNGDCRVVIKTEPRTGSVRLTVGDNGPGIQPDKLPHIFDPFFTTKRGAGGSGLGLSIVYAIVTGHGGSINVESRPGAGTRFLIDFPLQTDGEHHGKDTGR